MEHSLGRCTQAVTKYLLTYSVTSHIILGTQVQGRQRHTCVPVLRHSLPGRSWVCERDCEILSVGGFLITCASMTVSFGWSLWLRVILAQVLASQSAHTRSQGCVLWVPPPEAVASPPCLIHPRFQTPVTSPALLCLSLLLEVLGLSFSHLGFFCPSLIPPQICKSCRELSTACFSMCPQLQHFLHRKIWL